MFWSCLESARLAYYRGDNDALAKSGWRNCMNSAFHDSYGKYPLAAWRAFLKEFAIEETIITNP